MADSVSSQWKKFPMIKGIWFWGGDWTGIAWRCGGAGNSNPRRMVGQLLISEVNYRWLILLNNGCHGTYGVISFASRTYLGHWGIERITSTWLWKELEPTRWHDYISSLSRDTCFNASNSRVIIPHPKTAYSTLTNSLSTLTQKHPIITQILIILFHLTKSTLFIPNPRPLLIRTPIPSIMPPVDGQPNHLLLLYIFFKNASKTSALNPLLSSTAAIFFLNSFTTVSSYS